MRRDIRKCSIDTLKSEKAVKIFCEMVAKSNAWDGAKITAWYGDRSSNFELAEVELEETDVEDADG